MVPTGSSSNDSTDSATPAPLFPDRPPMPRHLDPAAALAFRTPLHEHVLSADGKAAGVITLLGMMFTVLARIAAQLGELVRPGPLRYFFSALIVGFAVSAMCAVVQSFRTISPRFPKAPPSLAFFDTAIQHGADIWNRGSQVGCAQIYLHAASAILARAPADSWSDMARGLQQALRQMLSYNHTTSRICIEKLRQLQRGLRCFEWAAGCWMLLVVILVLRAYVPW